MYYFLYILVFSTLLFVDVNNDGFLDEQELEALFTKEVKKKKKFRNLTGFTKWLQGCLYFFKDIWGLWTKN